MTGVRATVLAAVLLAASAGAAETGGGTVKGTIRADGAPVADATVLVEGPSMPAAPGAPHAVVDQRDMTFLPRVVAVAQGTTVDFPNHDTVLHNVFSTAAAKRFDLGMYDPGATKSVTFETPGVVPLHCNVHPKMEAFVVVHTNPYAAVTDAHGAYTIAGVPAGTYQVRVWHPSLAERRMPVTVRDGAVAPLDVQLERAR